MNVSKIVMPSLALVLLSGSPFLSSCNSPEAEMLQMAEEQLKGELEFPKTLEIKSTSQPDSAFGINYFTRAEINGIVKTMGAVTQQIMKSTQNMTSIDKVDYYVLDMAERQLQSAATINRIVTNPSPKGEWSGWKIKMDYQANNKHGLAYRAERWFFFSKDGKSILKSFDLPLP